MHIANYTRYCLLRTWVDQFSPKTTAVVNARERTTMVNRNPFPHFHYCIRETKIILISLFKNKRQWQLIAVSAKSPPATVYSNHNPLWPVERQRNWIIYRVVQVKAPAQLEDATPLTRRSKSSEMSFFYLNWSIREGWRSRSPTTS